MAVTGSPQDGGTTPPRPTAEERQRVDELIRRGAERMRATPAPGWFDVAARVTGAVRSATRRGLEIDAVWAASDPDRPDGPGQAGEPGDRLRISDLVVVDALRRALAEVPQCQPKAVDLLLEEHRDDGANGVSRRCRGAHVDLVAAFDVDLHAAAAQARRITLATLTELLGPPPEGVTRDAMVDVEIVDVTPTDPRR